MKTAKSSKSASKKNARKSTKRSTSEETERPSSKKKTGKKEKSTLAKSDLITRKYDEYVIKRLVKENPLREGTARYKVWNKLKTRMTVLEFIQACKGAYEGRGRNELRCYVENGWIKLRRPIA